MAKTIKSYEERIAEKNLKIQQAQNAKKKIKQAHNKALRKARDNRLYRRHGLLEKFMPDLIDITDAQYELFIKTGIVTSYGRKRLNEIIAAETEEAAAEVSKATVNGSPTNDENPLNGTVSEA